MTLSILRYVIHSVSGPWGLQPGQAGLLVSSGLVGFLFGALLHGAVADRFGRRGTLLGGLWVASVFTLLTAFLADSFVTFCTLRVLTGLGLGVLLPLGTTYINELTPRRVANMFALWGVAFGWALGGTAAGLVGVFLTPHLGWQSLYWIGALSFLLLPILHRHLPESPKFLILRGEAKPLKALLGRLRPERVAVYDTADIKRDVDAPAGNLISTLLQTPYRHTTIAIWSAAFLSLFCVFGLTGWIPTVMMQRGETFATSFSFGALMQIMSFIGGLACGHLVDRYGGGARPAGIVADIGGRGGAVDRLPQQSPYQYRRDRCRRLLHYWSAVRLEQLYRGVL
jgi:MFS family permease